MVLCHRRTWFINNKLISLLHIKLKKTKSYASSSLFPSSIVFQKTHFTDSKSRYSKSRQKVKEKNIIIKLGFGVPFQKICIFGKREGFSFSFSFRERKKTWASFLFHVRAGVVRRLAGRAEVAFLFFSFFFFFLLFKNSFLLFNLMYLVLWNLHIHTLSFTLRFETRERRGVVVTVLVFMWQIMRTRVYCRWLRCKCSHLMVIWSRSTTVQVSWNASKLLDFRS